MCGLIRAEVLKRTGLLESIQRAISCFAELSLMVHSWKYRSSFSCSGSTRREPSAPTIGRILTPCWHAWTR